MSNNLKRRGRMYWARLAVPRPLRKKAGKVEMMASLSTDSITEARDLAGPYVAGWQAWFKALERGDTAVTPQDYVKRAKLAAGVILNGIPGDLDALPQLNPQIILRRAQEEAKQVSEGTLRRFDAVMALDHYVDTYVATNPNPSVDDIEVIRKADRAARGELGPLLEDELNAFLRERTGDLTAQHRADLEKRCKAFVEWAGGALEVTEVTRKKAGQFVAEVVLVRDTSRATRVKEVSALRTWFGWLLLRGKIETNPFDKMTATIKESQRGSEEARRAWTVSELTTMVRHLEGFRSIYQQQLLSLMFLCLYSGARREEIGALKVSAVDAERRAFRIHEGKSGSAVRTVPIHPVIAGLVERLVRDSTDGYLISGLKARSLDAKRSHKLGGYFGQQLRAAGIRDPEVVLHSLRNTFATALEENEVPEKTAQQIVGHERSGMTYGIYSKGVSLAKCAEYVAAVSFGPVDTIARSYS